MSERGTIHRRFAKLIIAGSLGIAGIGGYEIYSNLNSNPVTKNLPQETTLSTPSPSPEITIFPSAEVSPTPEITPSPTPDLSKWYNQLPPDPYKNLNEVPLAKDSNGFNVTGDLTMEAVPDYKPYYQISANGFTILSVKPDIKNNKILMKVTTGINTIKQEGCTLYSINNQLINMCKIEGGNFNIIFKQGAGVTDGMNFIGTNLTDAAKYLKAGTQINFYMPLGRSPGADSTGLTNNDLAINQESWNIYRSEVGQKALGRTSSNLLTFVPYIIDISTS